MAFFEGAQVWCLWCWWVRGYREQRRVGEWVGEWAWLLTVGKDIDGGQRLLQLAQLVAHLHGEAILLQAGAEQRPRHFGVDAAVGPAAVRFGVHQVLGALAAHADPAPTSREVGGGGGGRRGKRVREGREISTEKGEQVEQNRNKIRNKTKTNAVCSCSCVYVCVCDTNAKTN